MTLSKGLIPSGVPEEGRSVQDYNLQDLRDAVKRGVTNGKACTRLQRGDNSPHCGVAWARARDYTTSHKYAYMTPMGYGV